MPKANTPAKAVERYLAPFNDAVRCIHHGTLITTRERRYVVGKAYSFVLNDADPLELETATPPSVYLSLGQVFEIVRDDEVDEGPFRVHTREYWYQISLDDDVELLAFHWTPETPRATERRYPHLHIGSVLLASRTPILPGTMHKRHIPTGRVSIESVVRFLIEELKVKTTIEHWSDVLDQGQAQFDRYRRP